MTYFFTHRRNAAVRTVLLSVPWILIAALFFLWIVWTPPELFSADYSRVVLAGDGTLLSARIAADGQWRFPPSGQALPPRYVSALLAFEDQRFYAHPGVDPVAIVRAVGANRRAGRVVSGGSTLTMQLARLALGNNRRTYATKIREALLALRIEASHTKEEILLLFAHNAPFGGNVVGLQAASWRYFGRPFLSITWAEAALLAVLPNAPALMHPGTGREALTEKRDRLLARLHAAGQLDATEYALALQEPVPAAPQPVPQQALHLLGTLSRERPDASRFETTLDSFLQRRSNEVLSQYGGALRQIGVSHAAALIVHVPTGEVHAYVGNLPPATPAGHGDFVDVARAPRSTGSLLKPFLYAALIDSGQLLPAQVVADIPTRIGGYIPENHTGVFSGAVRADVALAQSLNVPAARLLQEYGVSRFYALLKDLGMGTLFRPADDYGIPLILGGAESTLWDLTGMYASAARAVVGVADGTAPFAPPHVLADAAPVGNLSPLSRGSLYLALEALREVERPVSTTGWQHFTGSTRISWKTGTSYGLRDAWAVGVTEEYAVGVWVGNASGRGAPGLRGSATAGPILFRLFELLEPVSEFRSPGGMQRVSLCAFSGMAAGPDCAEQTTGLIPRGVHDPRVCTYCRTLHLNAERTLQVAASVYPVSQMAHERWFVLPGAMAYYARQLSAAYEPPPPLHPDLAGPAASLSLEFPLPGSQVYVPIEMSGERGRMVARAHHGEPGVRLFWHLDGRYLGDTERVHTMELSPGEGEHQLTVVSEHGERIATTFSVLSTR